MMWKMVIFVFSFFLLSQTTYVQEKIEEQEVQTVSPEDLRKATAEMKRVIRDAQKKSAEGMAKDLAKESERLEKQNQEILKRTHESDERLKQEILLSSARQKEDAEKERQARQKEILISTSITILILCCLALLVYMTRKGKTIIVKETLSESPQTGILTNPTANDLREFSKKNGGVSKIMFKLSLPQRGTDVDGESMICTAELRGDLSPLVHFDGENNPVTWDQRKKKAAVIALSKKSSHITENQHN